LRRPPHTSTLFPYTTLFRSKAGILQIVFESRIHERIGCCASARSDLLDLIPCGARGSRLLHPDQPIDIRKRLAILKRLREQNQSDRKSTRLNSSHSQISYAV